MCPYSESAGRTTTLTEQWLLGAKPLFKVASWPSRLDGSCVDRSIALNRVTATEDMDGPTEDIRHFASMRFEATAPELFVGRTEEGAQVRQQILCATAY